MDRLDAFFAATTSGSPEDITLRALTLHMLEHLAPRRFAARGLAQAQQQALEACAGVPYAFSREDEADLMQTGVDAWFCRHVRGLPHPRPDPQQLREALRWLEADGHLIYAWLIGELAARCGVDARLPVEGRPFKDDAPLHDAYWLTHLVMLDTDYFARPATHPQRGDWADALESLVPWLEQAPNPDLTGEVALCLRFLQRDPGPLVRLLEGASPSGDAHAQAAVLLGLWVE